MEFKKCQKCDASIPIMDAIYCDMCGSLLPQVPTSLQPVNPVINWRPLSILSEFTSPERHIASNQTNEPKTCSKCSHQNLLKHNFCDRCGSKLN